MVGKRAACNPRVLYKITKGAFQKSELAGRTMAGQVILTKKNAFSKRFC